MNALNWSAVWAGSQGIWKRKIQVLATILSPRFRKLLPKHRLKTFFSPVWEIFQKKYKLYIKLRRRNYIPYHNFNIVPYYTTPGSGNLVHTIPCPTIPSHNISNLQRWAQQWSFCVPRPCPPAPRNPGGGRWSQGRAFLEIPLEYILLAFTIPQRGSTKVSFMKNTRLWK